MPELPEVETIKRELNQKIKGKKIKDVEVRLAKMVKMPAAGFKKAVIGKTVTEVDRRAKNLIIRLSGSWNLLVHLKMTGQLIYQPTTNNSQLTTKYTHVIFYFVGGSKLLYNDLRQFGYIKLVGEEELQKLLSKDKLGPEPLDKNFTLKKFQESLAKKPRQKIKPLLMDQAFIAGIGNIYASEICFYAKVNPARRAESLTGKEIKNIYGGIKKILAEAIKYKGTSAENYVTTSGAKGNYEPRLKVYGRAGEKCPKCGGKIARIVLAQRGTFYCPKCQN